MTLAGCSESSGPTSVVPPNIDKEVPPVAADLAGKCDPLDDSHCLLPFPNDFFTVASPDTDTGRRLNLPREAMPRSVIANQRAIDPTEWNRNDGFSPGAMLVARIPGLDLQKTGAPSLSDLSVSLGKDSPVVLIDAETLERQLVWAELDQRQIPDERRTLHIRVAKNLAYGRRYIVALRHLKDASGGAIPASAAFRIFRDKHPSALPAVEERRPRMDALLDTLAKAGIQRKDLNLAWDFTVASKANLTGRMLAIRDAGLAATPDGVPPFQITRVADFTPAQDARIARRVQGTLTVPSFLFTPMGGDLSAFKLSLLPVLQGRPLDMSAVRAAFKTMGDKPAPLSRFHYASATPGVKDVPVRNGGATMAVPFQCNIPRSALAANGNVMPARIALYGHGLMGSLKEVDTDSVTAMGSEHNIVFCATNWSGMSVDDVVPVAYAFFDVSHMRDLFDTTQQGILNTLLLGRAMLGPRGFSSDGAFRMGQSSTSVLDTRALFYDGNSLGGILGGALVSVSPDVKRGVLGVPGMNFSLLMERSSDFKRFSPAMYSAYPDPLEQQLIISLMQTLWDRAESNGYALAMTSQSLAGTPQHQVLLQSAFGDHQVSMWSAEIMARSVGAKRHCPTVADGRHPDAKPYFQIECLPSGNASGRDGSALVVWDTGSDKVEPPPRGNTLPTKGHNPHEDPRSTPEARRQKSEFLKIDGQVVDVCNGQACRSVSRFP